LIYLLDTNIVSYIIKYNDLVLIDRFEQVSKHSVIGISSVTVAELDYGVKKRNSERLMLAVKQFLSPLKVYAFDDYSAGYYGDLRVELERKGQVIGSHDMLIAAHALSLDATLVTNNTREFERVNGLRLENWVST
jgi:tRNA(fMet)-specific endonuclease VapC